MGGSLLLPGDLTREAFGALAGILENAEFLRTADSWRLLAQLSSCWELLSGEQGEVLRPILEAACDKLGDPTGPMVVAEILGERFCDETSLGQLLRLSETLPMPARALMPHGLECFALTTEDPLLRQRCFDRLAALRSDEDPEVRDEAQLAWDSCHRPAQ